jgi:hypothetical protein
MWLKLLDTGGGGGGYTHFNQKFVDTQIFVENKGERK